MFTRLIVTGLALSLLVSTVGCHRWCRRDRDRCDLAPAPRGTPSPSSGPGIYLDEPIPTSPGGGVPPPVIPDSRGSFRIDPYKPTDGWDPSPTKPLFSTEAPPASSVPSTPSADPELLLPDSSGSFGPPSSIDIPSARKSNAPGYLGEPLKPRVEARSSAPAPSPAPTLTPSPAPIPAATPAPSRVEQAGFLNSPTTRSPVGLPAYGTVPGRSGVAAGGKPTLDGFDWLKANGYRTVVYLHDPDSDTSAARELAVARGLKFVPIAVSPTTLSRSYAAFAQTVEDRAARPVYVADSDSRRAGPLWYLLFRVADLQGDDVARIQATPLGLTDAKTELQKQYWLAIQQYLANR